MNDQAERRSGEEEHPPSVLTRRVGGCEVVAACCGRCRALGVREGMTLSQARALVADVRLNVAPHAPAHDAAALQKLAEWAIRFTPAVAADPPDGLLLDITGCERLYRGEARLLMLVGRAFERLGLGVRLAAAATVGCAWGLARYGAAAVAQVPAGREMEALAPLPIAALRVAADVAEGLARVGVCRIEQLLPLPRADLAARFGGALLQRLDQALGVHPEWIERIRPAEPLRLTREFDGPVRRLEAIEHATRELIDDLAPKLVALQSGVRRLTLELTRVGGRPAQVEIELTRPRLEGAYLWALLRPRLERVHLGYGVEALTLTAQRIERLSYVQWEQHGARPVETDERRAVGELIDALVNRLGQRAVLALSACESHLPERVFRLRCVSEKAAEGRRAGTRQVAYVGHGGPTLRARERVGRRGQTLLHERGGAFTPHDRPTVLLPSPEPVELLEAVGAAPDGPPRALRWRGRCERIVAALGPERIEPEWWLSEGIEPARDYFKAQDESGRWLWLMHERGSARWFVHGEWA